ncbi:FAD/NAD(P)-binding domain-containing protein [Neurospora hispaniola]|uniref:FAD/NAD(P)-binding domain-containing protein n=1 Tax=Neurospora hispaniola TaxID=588809 RepID=A0AAJ0MQW5_9PEZI|nr:FAD/NAD(P)-binding domain-containing protein [Neurospora hispaniola]
MAFSQFQPIGALTGVSFAISSSKVLRLADENGPEPPKDSTVLLPTMTTIDGMEGTVSSTTSTDCQSVKIMFDILIIGAGPSGLCAAKTFLQHNPTTNIVILDSHSTVGGVWSKERLYPTLRTNNLYPTMDFSDFPMKDVGIGRPGHHITGEEMHAYLTAYAHHFDLMKRIRFNTRAVRVHQVQEAAPSSDDGWKVDVHELGNPTTTTTLKAKKLVMATGILGVPNMPSLKGSETLDAPLLHSSALGPRYQDVLQNPHINRIAVLGGSKSAYDTVYLAATTGHKVDWIIRKSGRGPSWVFPSHTKIGPFKAWREKLVTRRIFTFMSPCVLPDHSGKHISWIRDFLHTNKVGKAMTKRFWKILHADTIRDCCYREGKAEKDKNFSLLEPNHSPFWYGTSSGTLNYEQDFKALVTSGQVTVHRQDVSHLSPHTIHFFADDAGKETLTGIDALICATGYSPQPPVDFFPPELHFHLGIPTTTDSLSNQQKAIWATYDQEADEVITKRFPQLIPPPPSIPTLTPTSVLCSPKTQESKQYTPWRLHRGIAPPTLTTSHTRNSLVFLSMHSNITNIPRIELQCLWSLAYFHDKIKDTVVSQQVLYKDTALFQRWCQLRSPLGHGRQYPDLNFDQLPYWDWLVADLGLKVRRKKSVWKELVSPYGSEDYRGLVEEWIEKYGINKGKGGEQVRRESEKRP